MISEERHGDVAGARGGTRTPDAHLRTVALYPLSYTGKDRDFSCERDRTTLSIRWQHPMDGPAGVPPKSVLAHYVMRGVDRDNMRYQARKVCFRPLSARKDKAGVVIVDGSGNDTLLAYPGLPGTEIMAVCAASFVAGGLVAMVCSGRRGEWRSPVSAQRSGR